MGENKAHLWDGLYGCLGAWQLAAYCYRARAHLHVLLPGRPSPFQRLFHTYRLLFLHERPRGWRCLVAMDVVEQNIVYSWALFVDMTSGQYWAQAQRARRALTTNVRNDGRTYGQRGSHRFCGRYLVLRPHLTSTGYRRSLFQPIASPYHHCPTLRCRPTAAASPAPASPALLSTASYRHFLHAYPGWFSFPLFPVASFVIFFSGRSRASVNAT